MENYLPSYLDTEFWEEELKNYAECGAASVGDNGGVWGYFKHCLCTQNRYFFKNPLISVILERYEKNTFVLKKDDLVYRARIDTDYKYANQCWVARDLHECEKAENSNFDSDGHILGDEIKKYYLRRAKNIRESEQYIDFLQRKSKGFEGFDEVNSGVPPYDKVREGRCNPEQVTFLYTSNDVHTAVAEVRPFIRDSVSVATISVKKDLKLVDFYYEVDNNGIIQIDDAFMHKMRSEFSALNKEKNNYLITQYLTLLAQDAGFDGLRFRSSLVKKGTNYVIFDGHTCIPIASKIYIIPEVKYSIRKILD